MYEFCILKGPHTALASRRLPLTHFMQMDAASVHLFYFLDCECASPLLVPQELEHTASIWQTNFSPSQEIHPNRQLNIKFNSLLAFHIWHSVAFKYWLHPHAHKEHHTWLYVLRGGAERRVVLAFSGAACVRGAPATYVRTYANSRLALSPAGAGGRKRSSGACSCACLHDEGWKVALLCSKLS